MISRLPGDASAVLDHRRLPTDKDLDFIRSADNREEIMPIAELPGRLALSSRAIWAVATGEFGVWIAPGTGANLPAWPFEVQRAFTIRATGLTI